MSYPSDWNQRRKKVYERDGYECQKCGESNTELHAHHIKPVSQGGDHELNNLITLCESCHKLAHSNPPWMEDGIIYSNWPYPFERFSEDDPVSEELECKSLRKIVNNMRSEKAKEMDENWDRKNEFENTKSKSRSTVSGTRSGEEQIEFMKDKFGERNVDQDESDNDHSKSITDRLRSFIK